MSPTIPEMEYTWQGVEHLVDDLAIGLSRVIKPRTILAIAKGGLCPATMLAHRWGVRHVATVSIQTYAGTVAAKSPSLSPVDQHTLAELRKAQEVAHYPILIIDDICDTGRTMQLVHSHLPRAMTAVLVVKPAGRTSVGYSADSVDQNTWVVFPWERLSPAIGAIQGLC